MIFCKMCNKRITSRKRVFSLTCDPECDKILQRRALKIGMKMVRGTILSPEELQIVYMIRTRRELYGRTRSVA